MHACDVGEDGTQHGTVHGLGAVQPTWCMAGGSPAIMQWQWLFNTGSSFFARAGLSHTGRVYSAIK